MSNTSNKTYWPLNKEKIITLRAMPKPGQWISIPYDIELERLKRENLEANGFYDYLKEYNRTDGLED
ncbi:MAG: hypothetical protein WC783_03965 [Candidatus Paceibacterota bacterium]|jgi:hypothetical protein